MWWLLFAIVTGSPKECAFGPGHWAGTAYQADVDEQWTIDAKVDLGGAVGTRVGTVTYPSLGCSGEWVREPDIAGRRVVRERITRDPKHACADGVSVQLAFKGAHLAYQAFYAAGGPCGVGVLSRAPGS